MVKVLHLYYDLLNLYGENANLRALIRALEEQEVKVQVDFKSLGDDITINNYDFIYVGSGCYEDLQLVKEDFKRFSDDIKKYIDSNKFILATGNGTDLFAGILKYKTKHIDFRIVGDQLFKCNLIDKDVIGFQNRDMVMYDINEDSLFTVTSGTGSEPEVTTEGIVKNHFYGTYLLGPILIRNPYLLEYLVKELFKFNKIKYKEVKQGIAYKAYEQALVNFGTYE